MGGYIFNLCLQMIFTLFHSCLTLIIDLMLPPLFTPYMYLQNGLTITIKDSENCQKAKNGTLGHMSRERD